jgi:hypothetical protein
MAAITITRAANGKITGLSRDDRRAYRAFVDAAKRLGHGEVLTFNFAMEPDQELHRKYLAMLRRVYESQEAFRSFDWFRRWAAIGTGHCEFTTSKTGDLVPVAKSISFSELADDLERQALYDGTVQFLWSEHARQRLWPHLSAGRTVDMMEALIGEFTPDDLVV